MLLLLVVWLVPCLLSLLRPVNQIFMMLTLAGYCLWLVSRARLDSFLFLGGGGKKESGQTALDVSFVLHPFSLHFEHASGSVWFFLKAVSMGTNGTHKA